MPRDAGGCCLQPISRPPRCPAPADLLKPLPSFLAAVLALFASLLQSHLLFASVSFRHVFSPTCPYSGLLPLAGCSRWMAVVVQGIAGSLAPASPAFLCILGSSQLPRLGTVPAPEVLLAHPPASLPAGSWEHRVAPSDPITFLICPGIHGDMELSQLILAGRAGMVPMARKLGNVEYFILKILETSISSKVLKKKKIKTKTKSLRQRELMVTPVLCYVNKI